jgi:TolA-binding protein
LAINSRIREIEKEIEEVKGEFDRVHKDRKLDNQLEELQRLSVLEQRRQALMEARRYVLGRLISSDSSPA